MIATVDGRPFLIAHLSDLHCGSPYFVGNLLERAIMEINHLEPDVVVCSGDLTTFGYKQEYRQAREYLDRLQCPDVITIPGNHDSRNVGYVHFEDMIGPRSTVLRKHGITFVAVDSSEPDLDHGVVGRGRYGWIERAVHRAGRLPRVRPAPPPAADPGHRPGAKRRPRRRRHPGGAAAGRRRPGALRPQARAVRLAAGGSVRGQRRHRLLAAPARAAPAPATTSSRSGPTRSRSTAAIRSTGAS